MSRNPLILATLASILALGACSTSSSSPAGPGGLSAADVPATLSVMPAAGATGVDPTKPIVLTFNMSMMSGMEMLVVVHEGSVTGPQVTGSASWSADRHVLTFTATTTLKAKTTYVVHLSPSLQGMNGKTIDLAQCTKIGGQSVSGGMMGSGANGMMGSGAGGMMNGSWGPGMMGAGWQASDGTFGMLFTFTTA